MVMMALDNPPSPVIPRVARVLLVCRTSRMMITRVRTLSETEIERYARTCHSAPTASVLRRMRMIPVTILSTLVLSVGVGSWRTKVHTYRAEVHKARERDDSEVHGIKNISTIELREELALDVWVGEYVIKQRTDQKTTG